MQTDQKHYEGHRQRLKERFLHSGLDSFHDHEVIELLLISAIPRKDVKPLAKKLLEAFGNLKGIMDADMEKLKNVQGIGNHAAFLVKFIKAIGTLYLKQKAQEKEQISSTEELLNYCKAAMGDLRNEHFKVIFLDTQNKIIQVETIQEGIVNQAVVYPRKVIERALQHNASALILVHNHPSGSIRPSEADIRLTTVIRNTAQTLEISVHDHIIIGNNAVFSFRTEGLL